jgi:hypothetical protein
MSHIFNLQPDIDLLRKLGYIDNFFEQSTPLRHYVKLEVESVTNAEERQLMESHFADLTNKFDLSDYNDTLLYITLVENERAGQLFELEHLTYEQRLRDKQLAQFLILYNPANKHKPLNVKIATAVSSINITSPDIIDWIGDLLREFIGHGEFIPGAHGSTLLRFISTEESLTIENGLNYAAIEAISNSLVKKPTIITRNKYLAPFLLRILLILNTFTPLKAATGIRFSDRQVNFLFKLAEIFNWLNENSIDSEPKDYLSSLLNNYLRKNNIL